MVIIIIIIVITIITTIITVMNLSYFIIWARGQDHIMFINHGPMGDVLEQSGAYSPMKWL